MFLDGKYFQDSELELPQYGRLPNSAVPGEIGYTLTQTVGENTLEYFIEKYEERFLIELLGDRLYEAWKEGVNAETPAQIWLDLKNRIYKVMPKVSLSPAANYVYFYAMRSSASDTTITGEVRQKGTFTENRTPLGKMVTAWNDMIDEVRRIREWIFIHRKEIYAAMPLPHYHDCHWHTWCQYEFGYINEYGI